ncbi:cyclic lactone autoinducer peptide [Eubacterium aggregans]|uniref:Cyclic lactone autoinducer peptide n=1 Tax=Eubacterium aggregans TaxID=81409 RepID=A0A1H4EMN3_9FIRM|nr:cyclic lactone autoinducer peptide [Eubacterium aggregans]MDD4508420.1 cyclic lactone autoinducer peptide [Eubacteriaceae bacterium]SEA86119.1 cyclic lactone autoinducer peptide [Eubacterium aggregans]
MKKIKTFLLRNMCLLSALVVCLVQSSDSCLFFSYQPEIPEELKKKSS